MPVLVLPVTGPTATGSPGRPALLDNTVDRDTVLTKDGGGSFSIGAISLATTNVVSGSFDLLFNRHKIR